MANCNKLFKDFNKELNITSTKRNDLIRSKNNLKSKIKDYFKENHSDYKPKFWIQGSYKMGTVIRTKDDQCDLDYGVYFFENPSDVSSRQLQSWVYNSADDVTDATSNHKDKCIRINYSAGYHIDLPVYLRDTDDENENSKLATRDNGYEESDPKKFYDWFLDEKDEDGQLVRIVKYLKSWSDNVRNKMPSGLAMTLLACYEIKYNDRDDKCLLDTLKAIKSRLDWNWALKMPTCPWDDLFEDIDDSKKEYIKEQLDSFISDAEDAIDEPNELNASKLWRKHLGTRFPEGKDEDTEAKEKALKGKAAILSSAPYANRKGEITSDSKNSKPVPDTSNYGGQI